MTSMGSGPFEISPAPLDTLRLIIGVALALILAAASYRARALTLGGAAAMVIIGAVVFGFGGLPFGVPIVFFFVTSSLFSRITSKTKAQSIKIFDKTGPRDYRQVLANGAAAALAAALWTLTQWPGWYAVYLAAIGEACADTWATEIGTLSRQRPVSIITWQRVEPGASGGITAVGTSAAAVGAFLTALSGLPFALAGPLCMAGPAACLLIPTAAAFIGSLGDSVLGGAIQGQYLNKTTGRLTEKAMHRNTPNQLVRGLRCVDNDLVNFTSTLLAATAAYIITDSLWFHVWLNG